jgi:7-cyano-7-deazaguanine synthase
MSVKKRAVVLLSGGLDSTTCLALAVAQELECYALSFDYGQRSRCELVAAAEIAQKMQVKEHRIIPMDMSGISGSALLDVAIAVPEKESEGIPVTYVPARNTLFLSYALAWAEVLCAEYIFIGVNARDYSGYPDCRLEYINAYQEMANIATRAGVEGQPLQIATPLMDLDKASIIRLGIAAGVDYSLTISCYQADTQGEACGVCDSCRFRRRGFLEAGVKDPTIYQEKRS